MSLHVTLLLHLVSGIVLRYNLCRSRGILRKQLRALLVLNALQLAFNPAILASSEGSDASWTLFVGYPVLALVLGVAALVKHGYADFLAALQLPLTRRLLHTATGILGIPQPTRRRSGFSAFSPRRQRLARRRSGVMSVTRTLLLSVFGLWRMAFVIFRRTVTSTWFAVRWLAPLASRLLVAVVIVSKRKAISSTHAVSSLVNTAYHHVVSSRSGLFGNEDRWNPAPSLDSAPACFPVDAVVPRSRFYDRWLLLAMSYRLQFGAWVAVERVWYRPSTVIMTETWLILVNHMGFECDLNNIYSSTSVRSA